MVEIRNEEMLRKFFQEQGKDLIGFQNLSGLVSKQFGNFLNAYSKAYNKKYNRKGKLFLKSLKRKPVKDDTYYAHLMYYIHQNPVHHGFVTSASEWLFSSYQIVLSRKKTQLQRKQVLDWFGGRKAFLEFHQQIQEIDIENFN